MIPKLEEKLAAHMAVFAREMGRRSRHGLFNGKEDGFPYVRHCTVDDPVTGTRLIYTRDTGHHSSGWMKNPEYERCLHLSLSPMMALPYPVPREILAEFNVKTKRLWVGTFFGNDVRHGWYESAKTDVGKRHGVEHWRVFCDERWKPITPRGEVYSSEFTELGWRSASQVLEEEGRVIISPLDPT